LTSADTTASANRWGYWATLGWAVLAFLGGQFIAFGLMVWLRAGDLNSILATPFDGILVTLFILISNPVTIALIALAVRLAHARQADYLGLVWPQTRYVTESIALLVVLIALSDALLYLSGRSLVTQFQLQSYTTAAAEGWLPAMFAGAILVAPAGEEVMFRGFLFRGWARSQRTVWPAVIVISLLWAGLHIQYDWTGVLQIFVIGLFLGWVRWRSGSMLLTFVLHALFNLEGTLETVVQVRFFS
jgi:membrane protease YdiL (CAAX protease family)